MDLTLVLGADKEGFCTTCVWLGWVTKGYWLKQVLAELILVILC